VLLRVSDQGGDVVVAKKGIGELFRPGEWKVGYGRGTEGDLVQVRG
jgi:hypothetical protein